MAPHAGGSTKSRGAGLVDEGQHLGLLRQHKQGEKRCNEAAAGNKQQTRQDFARAARVLSLGPPLDIPSRSCEI